MTGLGSSKVMSDEPSHIESLEDALLARRHEVADAVAAAFHSSVRAILVSKDGTNPEIVGSCILLVVDGKLFAVTAAHILDNLATHAIYIAGSVGTQPVQIQGVAMMTSLPPGGRQADKLDIGFWQLSQQATETLGLVSFIRESQFSHNRVPLKNRFYLAMGYPVSKNKRNVDNSKKAIKTSLAKYTAGVSDDPSVAEHYGVSGEQHLFLKYHKYSETHAQEKQRTFAPVGLSGGPLIDLGDFATLGRYAADTTPAGYLAGMVIERISQHSVLVAVRIQVIVEAIRAADSGSQ
jgi:hypothetical protein